MKRDRLYKVISCCVAGIFVLCLAVVGFATDGFGLLALLREENRGSALTSGYGYEYTWDPEEDETTGLDIHWVNGTVRLIPYEGKVIRVTERAEGGELSSSEKLSLSYSLGSLRIQWDRKLLRLPFLENRRKDLTVEVPRSLARQMDELFCENVSGDLWAQGFSAVDVHLLSVSGSVWAEEMKGESGVFQSTSGNVELIGGSFTQRLDLDSTSGEVRAAAVTDALFAESISGAVDFTGSARELNAHTVSGILEVSLADCPEEAYLDSVSGPITLTVPDNPGFTVTYSSVSGSFTSGFPLQGGDGKEGVGVYGSGAAKMEMETTSGEMALRVAPDHQGGT